MLIQGNGGCRTTKTTHRDFLNGTRIAIGASLFTPWTKVFSRDEKALLESLQLFDN
ncbi:MAG: hypothetical protein AAFR91_00210 [Pseudomonadota bacterium]